MSGVFNGCAVLDSVGTLLAAVKILTAVLRDMVSLVKGTLWMSKLKVEGEQRNFL